MRLTRLNEGISHLEDLPNDKFIRVIKNLDSYQCSEKIDGANLWLGIDEAGKLFTTREQKGRDKDRKYKSSDYNLVSAYNGFRSAHDAIIEKSNIIKKHLKPGDLVEVEVVFGKQPNVVKYSNSGVNYIILLRPVGGTTREAFDSLSSALDSQEAPVQTKIVDTIDGETVTKIREPFKWTFLKNVSKPVSSELISLKSAQFKLAQFEAFLSAKNEKMSSLLGKDMTNDDVLKLSMSRVPIPKRDDAKKEKELVIEKAFIDHKSKIKRSIMKDLMKNGKFLSTKLGSTEESDGIEGFVLLNDDNEEDQIKIVDRDLFTSVNEFNYKIRNELSGIVMSTDLSAPLESRGGIFGTCKLRIASLFELPELAKSAQAKKIFSKYLGDTEEQTIDNFAKSLNINDVNPFKMKISAILDDASNELKEKLKSFKEEASDYQVRLKTGKIVKYTDESKKRTLLAFAELSKEINELRESIKRSGSLNEILLALYGRLIKQTHLKNVNESVVHDLTKRRDKEMSFNLIKSVDHLLEDGDGGGDSAAPAETSPALGTTAGAIAPVPFRLFKGKILKRIKRNYVKKKKHK